MSVTHQKQSAGQRKPVVIFMHIPKAAGTTMHTILERAYRGRIICDLDTADLRASIAGFKRLPQEEKDKIDLLKGHLPFGMHEGFLRDFTYITMLRNPVDRIVSHYRYASENHSHYLNRHIVESNMDVVAYVESGISTELDNAMVRILSGRLYDVPYGGCDSGMLENAKSNLARHFSTIGLAESFDESVLLMKLKLGWSSYPVYYRKKVSKVRGSTAGLDEEARERIKARNQLDWELYEFAKDIFDADVLEHRDALDRELWKFRKVNALYGIVAGTGSQMVTRIKRSLPHRIGVS